MRPLAGFIAGLLAAMPVVRGAQQPATPPTYRSGVESVEVDVVVTTRKGQMVRDLAARDFQVFEDGKPQPVTTFERVDIPIERRERRAPSAPSAPSSEPDVTTNEHAAEGRVYVLVMDELHISPRALGEAKSAAHAFIEKLGENDMMAVVHTAGPDAASQEFTTSKHRLIAAVDQTSAHGLESATTVRNETAIASAGRRIEDTFDLERAHNAETTLRVLRDVGRWFETVHGRRKAILFMSEGIDYAMRMDDRPADPNSPWDVVLHEARDAIDAAMRSNVGVYPLDPNRLSGVDDIATEYFEPRSPSIGQRAAKRELNANEDNLRWLAEETGGIAVVGRSDLESAYDAIVADNSTYYVLAYAAPVHKRDGKFHKIGVRVDRPGVVVRTRSGYVSPKGGVPASEPAGGSSADLRGALATPLPVSGVPIRLALAPFKGDGPNASVLMTEDVIGRDLKLQASNTLELSYAAIDVHGLVRARSDDRLQLTSLDAGTKASVERSGIRLFNRLSLPAGRYTVKVAAHDEAGNTTGSIGYDLDVPDFGGRPLAMSGLVLTSVESDRMVVAKPDAAMSQVLPAPPITARAFSQADQVWLFAEVYDALGDAPHTTTIATTLRSDTGAVVYTTTSDHDPAEFHGQHGTFRYRVRVPLAGVAAGSYVLSVEAHTNGRRVESAVQHVPIRVTADKVTR